MSERSYRPSDGLSRLLTNPSDASSLLGGQDALPEALSGHKVDTETALRDSNDPPAPIEQGGPLYESDSTSGIADAHPDTHPSAQQPGEEKGPLSPADRVRQLRSLSAPPVLIAQSLANTAFTICEEFAREQWDGLSKINTALLILQYKALCEELLEGVAEFTGPGTVGAESSERSHS